VTALLTKPACEARCGLNMYVAYACCVCCDRTGTAVIAWAAVTACATAIVLEASSTYTVGSAVNERASERIRETSRPKELIHERRYRSVRYTGFVECATSVRILRALCAPMLVTKEAEYVGL
jgi:hypothetical protein